MSMADVYEWPKQLVLDLEKDDDAGDLNCWLCHKDKPNMTFTFRLHGSRHIAGLHSECVRTVNEQQATGKRPIARGKQ